MDFILVFLYLYNQKHKYPVTIAASVITIVQSTSYVPVQLWNTAQHA